MDWERFNQYVGVPGILAIVVTVAMVAWVFTGIEAPKEVWTLLGLAWGAYFNGQARTAIAARLGK